MSGPFITDHTVMVVIWFKNTIKFYSQGLDCGLHVHIFLAIFSVFLYLLYILSILYLLCKRFCVLWKLHSEPCLSAAVICMSPRSVPHFFVEVVLLILWPSVFIVFLNLFLVSWVNYYSGVSHVRSYYWVYIFKILEIVSYVCHVWF